MKLCVSSKSRCVIKLLVCMVLCLNLAGCAMMYSKRIVFKNHPVSVRVINKVIDEETIEYTVKFRNVGREIMSFDYTIADEPGVPHVDQDGPNSGLIENLYPGAEVEVANPANTMAVWVTLGTVTYGKKDKEELQAVYRPGSILESELPPL